MRKSNYMQEKLSKFRTAEYRKKQAQNLKKIKSKRCRAAITTSSHYVAMANSVCGAKRIESRNRINSAMLVKEGQNE